MQEPPITTHTCTSALLYCYCYITLLPHCKPLTYTKRTSAKIYAHSPRAPLQDRRCVTLLSQTAGRVTTLGHTTAPNHTTTPPPHLTTDRISVLLLLLLHRHIIIIDMTMPEPGPLSRACLVLEAAWATSSRHCAPGVRSLCCVQPVSIVLLLYWHHHTVTPRHQNLMTSSTLLLCPFLPGGSVGRPSTKPACCLTPLPSFLPGDGPLPPPLLSSLPPSDHRHRTNLLFPALLKASPTRHASQFVTLGQGLSVRPACLALPCLTLVKPHHFTTTLSAGCSVCK
ncbi:hypothetical protein E2C01_036036 [Portunus trituberculatus]|uniref:Uncharacterized protein n=1 Tax=Portunus trituberculatus TaxID=210409 RepID=A0A5B7FA06_PORTR|nr:hypothetical protein [Portunus trituberculatus]